MPSFRHCIKGLEVLLNYEFETLSITYIKIVCLSADKEFRRKSEFSLRKWIENSYWHKLRRNFEQD